MCQQTPFRLVSLLLGLIVLPGCGASAEQQAAGSDGGSTSGDGTSTGMTGASTTESSATGSGGASTASAGTGATPVGTTSTATSAGGTGSTGSTSSTNSTASGGTGGVGLPVCGDVACGPSLIVTILSPVPASELPGVTLTVCVDAICGSGAFPEFEPPETPGFAPEASFITSDVETGASSVPFSVTLYTDLPSIHIQHEFITGERVTVDFETPAGMVLDTVEGDLSTTRFESECLSCGTSVFSNLPL